MGALTITLTPARRASTQPAAAATATVGLLAFDVDAPISSSFPLVLNSSKSACSQADGTAGVVGNMQVRLELDYACSGVDAAALGDGAVALLSSFELNEHLASSRAAQAGDSTAPPARLASERCVDLVATLQDRCAAYGCWDVGPSW
jgi:hypothetical protein